MDYGIAERSFIGAALDRLGAHRRVFLRTWGVAAVIYFSVTALGHLALGSSDLAVGGLAALGVIMASALTAWGAVTWFRVVCNTPDAPMTKPIKTVWRTLWLWLGLWMVPVVLIVIFVAISAIFAALSGLPEDDRAFNVISYVAVYFGFPLVVLRFGLGLVARSIDAPPPGLRGSYVATRAMSGRIFGAALFIAFLSYLIEKLIELLFGQPYPFGAPLPDALIEALFFLASSAPVVLMLGEVYLRVAPSPVLPPEAPPQP